MDVAADRLPARVPADPRRRQDEVMRLLARLSEVVARCGVPLPPEASALRVERWGHRLRLDLVAGSCWPETFIAQRADQPGALWVEAGSQGTFLPPSAALETHPLLARLLARLDGHLVEVDTADAGERPVLPGSTWVHPDGWWDAWKDRLLDGRRLGALYAEVLYPRVATSLAGATRVLDVCGGDGALAETLGVPVTVLERNDHAVTQARRRSHVVQTDVRDDSAWEGLRGFDGVVGVGALEGAVMTRGDALGVLHQMARALAPGGRLVLTGAGACVVRAHDLAAEGLACTNLSAPPSRDGEARHYHYVARRRGQGST